MSVPSPRLSLLLAATLLAAPAVGAQSRDRWREEDRARERARIRAEETRERQRRLAEQRREEARRQAELRQRQARERALREAEARRRDRMRDDYRDYYRPRVSLGGGMDVREFGGDGDRFLVQGGVDFRSRSGLGVRPEVLVAWTESRTARSGSDLVVAGRSRLIGVAVSGTYSFLRSSPVRPYLISGLGVFSTRTPGPEVVFTPGGGSQPASRFRNDVDVGLNAGGGLEFDAGPVRLFTEFRYLLTDQPRLNGFGGMMPLTIGLRL
ncbi:hypothetical protein [Roseisolibacter sp. H3M3-2]|uniref:hypothetical protein n=1 Tax=Roseisolibacter sp. H3M3-2 TaxID=3031323 RepID=UPI0023D9FAFE|nr:hypothetical protein [Roseisolibacter sp. H3M3-2]MDF1501420.1 hypothetical protein [Roseisolibacter sp. H3M3-2]